MLADLHFHSLYSDGRNSVEDMVRTSPAGFLALTDHDTVSGVPEFIGIAHKYGKTALPGVELSTFLREEIHILAYNIDIKNPLITGTLATVNYHRNERNRLMIEKLNNLGMEITPEEVSAGALSTVNRYHIGQVLIRKGYVRDFGEALTRYLGDGKPCSSPNFNIETKSAVQLIKQAGGVPVLAHAGRLKSKGGDLFSLIGELVSYGIEGIEVYYPRHSQILIRKLKQICNANNLIATSGSDRHGTGDPGYCHELDPAALKKLGVI